MAWPTPVNPEVSKISSAVVVVSALDPVYSVELSSSVCALSLASVESEVSVATGSLVTVVVSLLTKAGKAKSMTVMVKVAVIDS